MSSVEADQEKEAELLVTAPAVRPLGTVGGVTSEISPPHGLPEETAPFSTLISPVPSV
ncbi:hypothetical protein D3C78_1496470 [compost metagenome]